MAGRVIRDVLTPRFKQGDFDGGVSAAIDAIITHLNKSPAEAAAIEEAAQAAEQQRASGGGFPFGGLIWLGFETDDIARWFQEAGLSDPEFEIQQPRNRGRELPATFIASARKRPT